MGEHFECLTCHLLSIFDTKGPNVVNSCYFQKALVEVFAKFGCAFILTNTILLGV